MRSAAALVAFLTVLIRPDPDTGAPCPGFDPRNCGLIRTVAPQGNDLTSAAFSPDGRALAVGCMDGTARVFETASWRQIRSLKAHPNGVKAVAWSPDGRMLATGGGLAVKVWDTAVWVELGSHFPGGFDPGGILSFGLAFTADGKSLLFAAEDGILRRWNNAAEGGAVQVVDAEGRNVAPAFSRDGRLAAAGSGSSIRLWNVESGERRRDLAENAEVQSLAFSRDGRRLAAGLPGMVAVWDLERGVREKVLGGFAEAVSAVAFTPDGRHVIGAGPETSVVVCETPTGREAAILRRHTEPILAVAVHPNGREFVTAGSDRVLRVWGRVPGGMARVKPPGFCGIRVQQDAEGRVAVVEVIPGTAAERAGLQAGDVILKVAGVEVLNPTQAIDQISSRFEGEEIEVELLRDRVVRAVRVRLGSRPPELRDQ